MQPLLERTRSDRLQVGLSPRGREASANFDDRAGDPVWASGGYGNFQARGRASLTVYRATYGGQGGTQTAARPGLKAG